MEIRLRFRYREADYVRGMRLHYMRRLHLRRDVGVAVAVTAFAMLSWAAFGYSWIWACSIGASACLLGLLAIAYWILPPFAFRSQAKLRDEYDLRFSDDGVLFKTEHIDSRLEWSLYKRLVSDAASYLLYYDRNACTVIPRAVFADEAQDSAFRALVERKIGAANIERANRPAV